MLTSSLFDAAVFASEITNFSPPVLAPVGSSISPSKSGQEQRRESPPTVAERPPQSRDETALAEVLRHPGIWRRSATSAGTIDAQPSGLAELDALLPGGGWPRGALSEILIEQDGLGECSLLLPALAALTQARRRVALIAPPYVPYAPALAAAGVDLAQLVHIDASGADTHWTAEQCLRAGCCGAVLNWLPQADYRQLRRLQLAAETGAAIGFVFRPLAAASQASPAALRLRVTAGEEGPRIEILKCRGRLGGATQTRLLA
ncbi:MAG: translesion DNA synthesis-associated protein ImuA [Dokdonella sp.]